MRTVALTAASSFTGMWIANHLAARDFVVHALFTEEPLSGLKKMRFENLDSRVKKHFGIRSEDATMARWIGKNKPQIWINHHHFMLNFRAPDYDMEMAEKVGIQPLAEIVSALRNSGCQSIIQSGTYFENGEGAQSRDYLPGPYAKSKERVWEKLLELRGNLSIGKVVISNPVGPFENFDRLIPNLVRNSVLKQAFHLRTPTSQMDNIPASDLAKAYETAILQSENAADPIVLRPSGRLLTNLDFAEEIVRELIVKRLALIATKLTSDTLSNSSCFQNNPQERVSSDWNAFWDHYAEKFRDRRYLDTLIDS